MPAARSEGWPVPTDAVRRLAAPDRGAAAALRRQEVHSLAAGSFLLLATFLCVTALAMPGVVRPGGWRVAFVVVLVATALFGMAAFRVRRLPEPWILCCLAAVDTAVVLSAACLEDRSAARLVAALFVLPTLYTGLFLPRWVLVPQAVAIAAGTATILWLGETESRMLLASLGIVVVSAMSPAVAVTVLRGRLIAALRQARELSSLDPLTGLANRRGFADRAPALVRRARRDGLAVGVVVADVDHFKQVNDLYGHAVGDEVLRAVALAVSERARPGDVVARLGGEELAVLAAATPRQLAALAESVRAGVREGAARWSVTVSAGVAWEEAPTAADAADALELLWTLVDRADDLMYASKRAGRNRVTLPAAAAVPRG